MQHPTFVVGLLHDRLHHAVEQAAAEQALCWAAYLMLAVVAQAPGQSQQGLADRTGVGRTMVGEVVTDLYEDGEVVCERDPLDRRKWRVYPGPGARERVAAARAAIVAAERRALLPLDPRERQRLRVLAERALPRRWVAWPG